MINLIIILGILSPIRVTANLVSDFDTPEITGQMIECYYRKNATNVDAFVTALKTLDIWRHVDVDAPISSRLGAITDVLVKNSCDFITQDQPAQIMILCGMLMEYDATIRRFNSYRTSTRHLTPFEDRRLNEDFRASLSKSAPVYNGDLEVAFTTSMAQLLFVTRHTFELPEGEKWSPAFDLLDELTVTALAGTDIPIHQLIQEAKFVADLIVLDDEDQWQEFSNLMRIREHLTTTEKKYVKSLVGMFEKDDDVFATSFDPALDTSALADQRDYQSFSSHYLSRHKRGGRGGGRGSGGKRPGSHRKRDPKKTNGGTAGSRKKIKEAHVRRKETEAANKLIAENIERKQSHFDTIHKKPPTTSNAADKVKTQNQQKKR